MLVAELVFGVELVTGFGVEPEFGFVSDTEVGEPVLLLSVKELLKK